MQLCSCISREKTERPGMSYVLPLHQQSIRLRHKCSCVAAHQVKQPSIQAGCTAIHQGLHQQSTWLSHKCSCVAAHQVKQQSIQAGCTAVHQGLHQQSIARGGGCKASSTGRRRLPCQQHGGGKLAATPGQHEGKAAASATRRGDCNVGSTKGRLQCRQHEG